MAYVGARVVYALGTEVSRARELGSYDLVERLGEGRMGEVWRAKHRMLARPAAIKLIRPSAAGDARSRLSDEARRRFEREAQGDREPAIAAHHRDDRNTAMACKSKYRISKTILRRRWSSVGRVPRKEVEFALDRYLDPPQRMGEAFPRSDSCLRSISDRAKSGTRTGWSARSALAGARSCSSR